MPKIKIKLNPNDKEKADSLMNESNRKKAFANEQEKFANASIKVGKGSNVRVLDLKGTTTPTAYERLEIVKRARQDAKKDSIDSENLRKK